MGSGGPRVHTGKRFKFRLLCKRCNSYVKTFLDTEPDGLRLWCENCGNTANDLDEEIK